MAKDYYSILGVSRGASQDEIKKAYRRLAHQHHPDKGSGGDEQKFKEINEAYQVLGNPDKRKSYDQFGSSFGGNASQGQGFGGFSWEDFQRAQQQGFGSQNVEFDLGDIFGDLFGFGGGRSNRRRSSTMRGQDIEATLEVDFMDAVFGSTQRVEIAHQVSCHSCKGSGSEPGSTKSTCATCKGSGQVETVQRTVFGNFASRSVCPACRGEGSVITKKCSVCGGDGRMYKREYIDVKIPAGINDGEKIRLSGKGEAGVRGGAGGDLYLTIRVRPHDFFVRDGDTIETTLRISIPEAVLGTKADVQTVDGEIVLKIPAGTPSGKKFILRGKGVPHLRSRGRGDHIVTVDIAIPKKLSREEKELYESLRRLA